MPRLPVPGADEGTWGDILNQYLLASHKSDGSLKDDAVPATAIPDATITEAKLDSALATKVNGAGGGNPTMGGDLSGTASNAQIVAGAVGTAELAAGAVTDAKVASGIAQAKITNLTTDLSTLSTDVASKVDTSDSRLTDERTPLDGSVTTAKIADANVTAAKLANSSVSTTKIADANVTTAKLADGAVTVAKLGTAVGPTNGQLLVYNGTTLSWTDPTGVPTTLDDLSDVNTTGAADGQSLVYQSGTSTWVPATVSSGGGVTDHGALTGLADDDHAQYHNDARGDARYYQKSEIDTSLAGKVDDSDARLSDNRTPVDGSVTAAKLASDSVTEPKLSVTNTPSSSDVLSWNGSGLEWTAAGAGVSDHGALTGLSDDDHTQYHTDARGDARYYTQSQVDTSLSGKANTSHTHAAGDITSGTIGAARLGSGTADNTTYLRGDGTWATPTAGSVTYADVPAGSTFTVYKPTAGSWPGARPSARTDIYFIFKGSGTAGTGTSPESIMIDGDDWQILP